MKPKPIPEDALALFQAHFKQLLDLQHPLVQLAEQIDWTHFEAVFADCYCPEIGAPAKAIRLMVGLHYLKYAFNESDESVVARWVENPYWQYFCGESFLQHECPIHPTSMTKWRQRVGAERLNELLKQTIEVAVKEKHLPVRELQQVTVDTTVQEKNITHPTDSKLLYQAIVKLADATRTRGIRLRQSYLRVGKRAALKAGRYAHARQFRRMRRCISFLRVRVGRLIRDIQRQVTMPDDALATLLELCQRLCAQRRQDSKKLYSLHEPAVCCISKGKARKRYEFGQKIALATTNRRDWFVAAVLLPDNPYDGHTLSQTIAAVEENTGVPLSAVYVDRGYRGHNYEGAAEVHLAGHKTTSKSRKKLTAVQRQRRKRRSAIEPKIGHAKSDHRMGRCYLQGLPGDAMNAILAAAASNFRKLLNLIASLSSCVPFIQLLRSNPHGLNLGGQGSPVRWGAAPPFARLPGQQSTTRKLVA